MNTAAWLETIGEANALDIFECYALFLEDRISFRVCSTAHEPLAIPPFETRLKEGELVVEGKVMMLDEWKKGIKKSWGL